MSFIFELPYNEWSFSIPHLPQIDTSMGTHINPTRGVDGTNRASLQRLTSHENNSGRTRGHFLQSPLTRTTTGDALACDRVIAPAFLVGKVNLLPWPNPYDFVIFDLSRSFGSLDLDSRQLCDSDESAERRKCGERNSYRTDDINNSTNYPRNRDLPPSANTRSRHRQGSDSGGSPPREKQAESRSFDPYGPPKSILEINNAIKDILLRHQADADEGFVYGFQHPEDIALDPSLPGAHEWSPHLIKIGRSKNHRVRMRQISKKCGYTPHTVFAHSMPRHGMVERVVHTQMHNSRLRDVGCTGCGTRHEEWFQVDVRYAEHVVELWKAFVESRPYDEQGSILPAWRERLEQLDLGDADCWQHFVHETPLDRLAAGSPQELEAENCYDGLVAGQINPSSDGDVGRDEQQESN